LFPTTYLCESAFLCSIVTKVNTEIGRTLRQISDCKCRPLYQILNWCIPQSSLIHHTEKSTQEFLLFYWLIKPAVKFYCYIMCLQGGEKKERTINFPLPPHFFSSPILPTQKQSGVPLKYFSIDKSSTEEKVWKVLEYSNKTQNRGVII
jgi:hypothetical protein